MKNVFGHFQISLGGQNCPSLSTTNLKVRVLGLEKGGLQPALYNFFLIISKMWIFKKFRNESRESPGVWVPLDMVSRTQSLSTAGAWAQERTQVWSPTDPASRPAPSMHWLCGQAGVCFPRCSVETMIHTHPLWDTPLLWVCAPSSTRG